MMNEQEFYHRVLSDIPSFLPPSCEGASLSLMEQAKNNDILMTGLTVRLPGEAAAPVIYLRSYFEEYRDGRALDRVLSEIAAIADRARPEIFGKDIPALLSDYETVKPRLQMRVYDTENNEKRLEGIVHHSFGDYSSAYAVLIDEQPSGSFSVMVTPALMDQWGITKKQLHEDTARADLARGAAL